MLKSATFKAEEGQKLTVESFITMTWFDDRLTWNPQDFTGAPNTTFAAVDELWVPDVNMYNS